MFTTLPRPSTASGPRARMTIRYGLLTLPIQSSLWRDSHLWMPYVR